MKMKTVILVVGYLMLRVNDQIYSQIFYQACGHLSRPVNDWALNQAMHQALDQVLDQGWE